MTLFTLLLSQSKYKSCQLRCPLQGRGKESRTGTRTADTNYLSNWSKCSQKCHLLKDQLITSSCSPNRLTKKKKKKVLEVFRTAPLPPLFLVSFAIWCLSVLYFAQLMRLWVIFITKPAASFWKSGPLRAENRHVTCSPCQIKYENHNR